MATEVARGVRNNNPGNIEYSPKVRWQGLDEAKPTDGRFCRFTGPEWGIRAIARILITYQDGRTAEDGSKIDTIAEAITRWAPASENDTAAYVAHVCDQMNKGPNDAIDVHQYDDMIGIVRGIIAHECGNYRYPENVMAEGLKLAGIKKPLPAFLRDPKVIGATATAAAPVVQQSVYYVDSTWGWLRDKGIDPMIVLYASSVVGLVGLVVLGFYLWRNR